MSAPHFELALVLEQIIKRRARVIRTLTCFAGCFFFDHHADGIERAVVALVLGRDSGGNRLIAFEAAGWVKVFALFAACRSNPHFGHCPTGAERFCSSAPHSAQRETVRVPGMLIGRGPNVFSFLGAEGFSKSFFGPLPAPESWYPRCRYLRSDKKRLLKNALFSAFGARGTRVSL